MARLKNKKRKAPMKAPVQVLKNQPSVDQITGQKIPKSFVFSRGRLPAPLKQLELDLRKLMLPHTALKLKEKKRNKLKDFLNVAGPMGVTHFLMLSHPKSIPHLRVARTPQGPTLTFEIQEYSLAHDIAQSQSRPSCPKEIFNNSPLIVLSGFGGGGQHLKLATIMFQNIFPAIDINTVKLSSCRRIVLLNYNTETKLVDFRHYLIRLQPVGISRRIRKFVQKHEVPDLRNLQDVSEFVTNYVRFLSKLQKVDIYLTTRAGYGSESEADEELATVSLASDVGRVNRTSSRSAVRLQEIGPRMTLRLVKVEEGLCSGSTIFTEFGKEVDDPHIDAEEER